MEEKLSENKLYPNKLDQYHRRINIDEALGNKVIDIFKCLNLTVQSNDIEGRRRLGKAILEYKVRFINRKFCYEALEEKADLKNVNNHNLGFESNTKLFLSENLTNNWLGCVGN